MKVIGLKVVADKGWKPDGKFTADDGRTMAIPANHKVVCSDENGDIVNVSIVSPSPVAIRVGQALDVLTLAGSVSKNAFGWTLKASIATTAKA